MLIKKSFGLSIVSLAVGESLVIFGKIPTNTNDYAEVDVVNRYKRKRFSYDEPVGCYKLDAKKDTIVLLERYNDATKSARNCYSIRGDRAAEGIIGVSAKKIGKKRFLLYSCEAIVKSDFDDGGCGYYIVEHAVAAQ